MEICGGGEGALMYYHRKCMQDLVGLDGWDGFGRVGAKQSREPGR